MADSHSTQCPKCGGKKSHAATVCRLCAVSPTDEHGEHRRRLARARQLRYRDRTGQRKYGTFAAFNEARKVAPKTPHIADHGYVVIGDRYEHQIVAEQILGRPLAVGEQVHHVNGDRTDNRPGNLEVCASASQHHFRHRKSGSRLRLPDEPNPMIVCACGCGAVFARFDQFGRPRRYVTSGHIPGRVPTTRPAVLAALAAGPMFRGDIALAVGVSFGSVSQTLNRLRKIGKVRPTGNGWWSLT